MNLQSDADQFLERKYSSMLISEYEEIVKETAVYPDSYKILYPALGMAGEAGEVANKVKKLVRDGLDAQPEEWRTNIAKEIGDVLWYCAALARDLDVPLSVIAAQNKDKLLERKKKGTLQGSGDDR